MHRDETGSKVVLAEGPYCSKDLLLLLAQTHDRHISYIFFGHSLFQEKEHKRTNDRKGILKNGANDRYSFFEELIRSCQSRI